MEKRNWLKIVGGLVVVAFVVWIFAIMVKKSSNNSAMSKPVFKIGLSLPLSGDVAFLGEGAKVAADLARANFTNTKFDYELVYEDDQFNPAKAATTVNKLVNIDKVNALVSFGSPAGNSIASIAEKSQVVHFGVASDQNVANGKYNFIHWTPPYEETKVLVAELQKRNVKKVVLFETNQPGVLAVTDDLRSKIKNTDIAIVSQQRFNPGEKDFRSYITKAKENVADIYVLEAVSPELEILTTQLKQLGVTTPITSIEGFEFSDKPSLFEGEWYVGPAVSSAAFNSAYNSKTGKNPTIGTPNVYDIVSLTITAAEKTSGRNLPSTEQLLNQVFSIKNFTGALGTLNFDQNGVVVSNAILKIIKNGKPEVLK